MNHFISHLCEEHTIFLPIFWVIRMKSTCIRKLKIMKLVSGHWLKNASESAVTLRLD